jgi:carboxyl-terminal processing protease
MTEDEKKVYQEEQAQAEEAAKLRDEDYQLAYAIDILKGLRVMGTDPESANSTSAEAVQP